MQEKVWCLLEKFLVCYLRFVFFLQVINQRKGFFHLRKLTWEIFEGFCEVFYLSGQSHLRTGVKCKCKVKQNANIFKVTIEIPKTCNLTLFLCFLLSSLYKFHAFFNRYIGDFEHSVVGTWQKKCWESIVSSVVLFHEKKQVVCELNFSGNFRHFIEKRLPWCSFLLKLMKHVLLLKHILM